MPPEDWEQTLGAGPLLGIAVGAIALLLFLIIRLRLHAFLALILVSLLTAFATGVPAGSVVSVLTTGFGTTLGSVALLVGLGAMLGRMVETSGGAKVMADSLVQRFGAVVARDALARAGWPGSSPGRNALDVHVLRLRRRLLLFSFMRCVSRRRPARGLIVLLLLLLLLVLRVRWCRLDAQSRLRRRWRLRCRSRNSDGALCLLNIHDGGRAEVRRRGLVGGGLRWWVVCGGESCRRVLGTSVGV